MIPTRFSTLRLTVEPYLFGNGHPRFFGWVNSPPTIMGIFADALAAAMNPSRAGGNHAAIYVEKQIVNWFKELLSYPRDACGLLLSGGSMAALTALAVARHVKCGFDVRAHGLQQRPGSCSTRPPRARLPSEAIELLGIGSITFVIDHDAAFRMRPASPPRRSRAIGRRAVRRSRSSPAREP